jgi:hypothetical protein
MPTKWNMSIPWPKENYQLLITKATLTSSKRTDNPMGLFECEVFSPTTVTQGSQEITTQGVPLKHYKVTKTMAGDSVDVEKTANNTAQLQEWYNQCGVDFSTYDPENPNFSAFEGKKIWVILRNKSTEKRKDPTDAQKAAGEQGDVLVDPITGQKAVTNYPEIDSVWGPVAAGQ